MALLQRHHRRVRVGAITMRNKLWVGCLSGSSTQGSVALCGGLELAQQARGGRAGRGRSRPQPRLVHAAAGCFSVAMRLAQVKRAHAVASAVVHTSACRTERDACRLRFCERIVGRAVLVLTAMFARERNPHRRWSRARCGLRSGRRRCVDDVASAIAARALGRRDHSATVLRHVLRIVGVEDTDGVVRFAVALFAVVERVASVRRVAPVMRKRPPHHRVRAVALVRWVGRGAVDLAAVAHSAARVERAPASVRLEAARGVL